MEGHGEVESVPILIRRLATQEFGAPTVRIFPPYRLPRGRILKPDELNKVVEFGGRKLAEHAGPGGILLLLDADSDCPAELGPQLLQQVRQSRPDILSAVVLANIEFEAWFLAAIRSLAGRGNVMAGREPPPNPEGIRGAKEYLERHYFAPGRKYSPTVDQPALTRLMSLAEAQSAPSFEKLCREMARFFNPNLPVGQ